MACPQHACLIIFDVPPAMHPCTFAKNTSSKHRSWRDGFFSIKNNVLYLYDKNSVCISRLNKYEYSEAECGFDSEAYTIYLEAKDEIKEKAAPAHTLLPEGRVSSNRNELASKSPSRENSEILELFKKE